MNTKCLVIGLLLFLFIAPAWAQTGERYNLISVVTDDQARWSVGAYGNHEARTPNMDRLAREGAKFLNAFVVTPVCSPSRVAFMTGLYGTQVNITDYIAPNEDAAGLGLPASATTWPEVLQRNGYRTALLGKWHLGSQPQFHPTKRGFDQFYGFLGGGNTPLNPTLEVHGKQEKLQGSLPDLLTDEALRFVEANQARPFALSLHFRAPHLPYAPVLAVDSEPFKPLDPTIPDFKGLDVVQTKRLYREYYASIHSVDRNLGRLLEQLDKLDLTRKTIVMFTSDHGYNLGRHGVHTKGNGQWMLGGVNGPTRPNMWDTSLAIPLLVRWPGVVKPGSEIAEMVVNLDTFASVLGMLGLTMPSGVRQEGRDFSSLLREQKVAWRSEIYGQYDLHNGGLAFMRMIRTGEWKLVRHHHANQMNELYDLKNDPDETRNLYGNANQRTVRDELQRKLTAWQQSINDPLLREKSRLVFER